MCIRSTGADEESRTRGEIDGRESIARTVKFVREHVPGTNAPMWQASARWCRRASRGAFVGNAYVTVDDYVNGVCPPDSVCYSFYPVDVHRGTEDKPLDNVFLDEGRVPGIPLGALIARGFDNLMMAGRIASGDRPGAERVPRTGLLHGHGRSDGYRGGRSGEAGRARDRNRRGRASPQAARQRRARAGHRRRAVTQCLRVSF